MNDTLDYSREAEYRASCGIICGVDEAGRGPLAGDVFAAAVILPEDLCLDHLGDSKKLTAKRRDILYDEITASAVSWAVASATVEEIDALDILNASQLAMRRAIEALTQKPDAALIDGNIARGMPVKAFTVIGGDAVIPSIAAASILAKVSRDRYCMTLDEKYPEYGFASHKGYGTKAHVAAILKYGPTPEHRRLFLRKITGERS